MCCRVARIGEPQVNIGYLAAYAYAPFFLRVSPGMAGALPAPVGNSPRHHLRICENDTHDGHFFDHRTR